MKRIFEVCVFLALCLTVGVLLAGCGPKVREVRVPVEVKVAVPVKVYPPADLLTPVVPERLPVWVGPAEPTASSCLTAEGERDLKALILQYRIREAGWQGWASNGR